MALAAQPKLSCTRWPQSSACARAMLASRSRSKVGRLLGSTVPGFCVPHLVERRANRKRRPPAVVEHRRRLLLVRAYRGNRRKRRRLAGPPRIRRRRARPLRSRLQTRQMQGTRRRRRLQAAERQRHQRQAPPAPAPTPAQPVAAPVPRAGRRLSDRMPAQLRASLPILGMKTMLKLPCGVPCPNDRPED